MTDTAVHAVSLITCEHGGKHIPPIYQPLFAHQAALLDTHRGYDAGALQMARELASALAAPLISSTTSRLLVDLNRSIGHPALFSATTRALSPAERTHILKEHYLPYRRAVELEVELALARSGPVLHISSHSFTPELDGVVRNADVGLLYDPARRGEAELCRQWKAALAIAAPDLRVRRNYPYRGQNDGLTAALRKRFPPDAYIGIELEINQAIVIAGGRHWTRLRRALIETLQAQSTDAVARPISHSVSPTRDR